MERENVVVIGSGMAGFGAATRIAAEGRRPVVYDQNAYYGGHTASFRDEKGFLFDRGPHISFTKDERIQRFLADNVKGEYEALQVNLNNYWQGHWVTHPVQLHLNRLPTDLVVKIIADFVAEQQRGERPVKNYEDWLVASYGKTFAETFPMTYARKYHLTTASNMSTDWLGPRMYRPTLEELLRGALAPWTPDKHYISHFRYPKNGGFYSYLKPFPGTAELKLGQKLVSIDPKRRSLKFASGNVVGFDGLVSSVPLPELIPMIVGAPADVLAAARKLACSTCVLVNVGVDRADLSTAHMSYFYDEDICFSRLSFPHMLSGSNVPPGCGSIQAEVYFSKKYRPLTGSLDVWIDPVIDALKRSGVLREGDKILTRQAKLVEYANVIFDLDRMAAVETVHGYLNDVNIGYCGRYGDWGYMWTDESFISGEQAAERALARSTASRQCRPAIR
jgi:protoporphyrinogen oxidase